MLDKMAYSIDELAKVGVEGRTKLFAAVKSGRLKARKSGRQTLVLREDFETYLKDLPVIDHAREDAGK